MNNTTIKILIAFVLVGVAAGATLYVRFKIGLTKEIAMPRISASQLPKELGSWNGKDQVLTERAFRSTEATEVLSRRYANLAGKETTLHVAVFGTFWIDVPHSPLICYPGSGWLKVNAKPVELKTADKSPARVQLATFEMEGQRVLIMFWYQFGDAIFVDADGMDEAKKQYRTNDKWPSIVKVLIQTDASNAEQAEKRLMEFGSLVYEWTSKMQNGDSKPSSANSAEKP